MSAPIALRALDESIYQTEIAPWLPPQIIDAHVHVSLREHFGPVSPQRYSKIWALEVGIDQPWETLRETYRCLFPDKSVWSLAFGGVYHEIDLERENRYVLQGLDSHSRALYVIRPEWDPKLLEAALASGFAGAKPYPDLAPGGIEDVSIYEFLPEKHLEVLNRHSAVLMLHISRPGRIGDPRNVDEIREINDRYPNVKIILAHVGRAYCLPTAEKGLPALADRPDIYVDISANLNADVFAYALETLGIDRVLFGSDLPITGMRGVREHVGERYINFTDAPYSWNTRRKSPEEEARYTFFLYEELRALISAVRRLGLGKEAIGRVMYTNAARLLGLPALSSLEPSHT